MCLFKEREQFWTWALSALFLDFYADVSGYSKKIKLKFFEKFSKNFLDFFFNFYQIAWNVSTKKFVPIGYSKILWT